VLWFADIGAGAVTATVRSSLDDNSQSAFIDDDFEFIEGGVMDLAASPRKLTFSIEKKLVSALRFADAGAGNYKVVIKQFGRIDA